MCRHILTLIALVSLSSSLLAQGPPPAQPTQLVTNKLWVAPEALAPQQVPSASVQVSGIAGQATFFYWIVSKYTIGNSTPAGPFAITNAPNTLNGSNFDVVRWNPVSDAGVTYDVLRTTTPVMPSGPCACAVATAVAGGSTNDQSASLNAYTVTTLDPNVLNFTIQSEVQGLASSHLILRQNGAFVSDLSTGGSGSLPPGVAPGSALVSNGIGALVPPVYQIKPIYDVRDWMTCDGTTDASTGMNTLLSTIGTSEATIRFIGSTTSSAACRIGNTFFNSNITLDFSGGGALQLISSSTPIGNGTYVSGTSVECGAGTTCSLPPFTVTTGNTIIVAEAPYPGFNPNKTTKVTDNCGNFYIHVFQSLNNQTRNQGAWVASSVTGGTCTITATANTSLTTHMMLVAQVSGMGPVASLDASASNNNTGFTMSTGSVTTLTGAFLFAFGGEPFAAGQSCAAGAGYTQPAGLAGQSSSAHICAEYNNASAGGSTSATQTLSVNPSPGLWVDSLISLKPGNATATIWGGILNPDQHKIFLNADSVPGHGVIDFTGSTITLDVYPEWWGATSNDSTGSTNTPALQASIWAAFGGGQTQARTNASGLSIYNRPLRIGTQYTINDELKMFDVLGFRMYGVNRLSSGIAQGATNKRIVNSQSMAYGHVADMTFSTQASQNVPLFDLDWDGVSTPGDIKPQFVDFDRVGFNGNNVGFIGLEIAKSGGAAQGSNIYCRDCAALGFTEACYQVGTHAALATNALAIGISGDIQGCPKYGIAVYGGGNVSFGGGVEESTMENGFTTQTGYDMYCELAVAPCIMYDVRSESRKLAAGNILQITNSRTIDQHQTPLPGNTSPVGTVGGGNFVTGDGAYYQVTSNAGPYNGVGTVAAPVLASSGTATTVTDTNQNIPGSNTIKIFTSGETVTQAVTGSTGTLLNTPISTATVTGTLTSGLFQGLETATQSVTGVTAVVQFPTPNNTGPVPLTLQNLSGTADSTHTWTGGTSGAVYTPNAAPTFSATTMLITAATGAPDNSHNWTGGTSGAVFVPTGVPTNAANFTVNGFVGMLVGFVSGTNIGCYGVITANIAQTITAAAGWTTKYSQLQCFAPDITSSFVVEPNWNHGTVTDGGMTLVYMNENVIGPSGQGGITFSGRLQDVSVPGGQITPDIRGNSVLSNVSVTRPDWINTPTNSQVCCGIGRNWDVSISSTVSATSNTQPYRGTYYQNWTLPSLTGVPFSGPLQQQMGTKVIVFSIGSTGAAPSNSANDVWLGGRSDPTSANDATRAILEYGGMLGRAAPVPSAANGFNLTNLPGTDSDFTGGPSTGNANGGGINFWTSSPVAAPTTPNSGLKRWSISPTGNLLAGLDNTYTIGAAGANRPSAVNTLTTNVGDPSFGSNTTKTSAACETSYGITTLSVAGTTTDTGLNCLPANSIIDAVVYRITTTITTAASFTIGDATTAARFCSTQSTLTAGTTGICFVQADQTAAAGPRQTAAAKVRVTTNVNPGAGAIRLIVYYHTWTPPTS